MNIFNYLTQNFSGKFIVFLLVVDAVAFMVGIALVALFRARHTLRDTVYEKPLDAARRAVEGILAGEARERELRTAVNGLPLRLQTSVFHDYTQVVAGESRKVLLEAFGGTELPGRVRKAARSRAWWKRLLAVRTLDVFPDKEIEDELVGFLNDPNPFVRINAIHIAAKYPTGRVVEEVFGLYRKWVVSGYEQYVEIHAVKDTITRFGKRVTDRVRELLGPEMPERCVLTTLEIAEDLKAPELRVPVLVLLRKGNAKVRAAAAETLAAFADAEAGAELRVALRDEDAHVRAMAAYALGKAQDTGAVGALVAAFPDAAWEVRFHCANALRSLGHEGREALSDCRKHGDRYVVEMARHVLSLPEIAMGDGR